MARVIQYMVRENIFQKCKGEPKIEQNYKLFANKMRVQIQIFYKKHVYKKHEAEIRQK